MSAERIAKPAGAGSAFEQFLEFVPDVIVGVGRDGGIVLVNQQAEELFGYPCDGLLGEAVELLVPERFRATHPTHRENYFEEPRTRPMGVGIELFAVRRNGTEFVAGERIRTLRPQLPVLYMSGYSHEVMAPRALTDNGVSAFIEKPFSAQALKEAVCDLLDRREGRVAAGDGG